LQDIFEYKNPVPLQWSKPTQGLDVNEWSLQFKDFVAKCLTKDLKLRWSLKQINDVN
jgi:hypothetical protein